MQIAAVPITCWLPRAALEARLAAIDPRRAARLAPLRRDEDFQRGLLGDLLVSHLVRRLVPRTEEILRVDEVELGKPYLPDHPELEFNLSHSGSWVACAIASSPVGIDVELVKPVNLGIARRFFFRCEHDELMRRAPADRLDYFFALWAVKESYMKWTGQGFSLGLDAFSAHWSTPTDIRFCAGDRPIEGVVASLTDALPGHKLAVCATERPPLEDLEIIAMESLL